MSLPAAGEIFESSVPLSDGVAHEFTCVQEGRYRLELGELGISFEVDRLRRKWDELVGELTVRCAMAGARTVNGVLSVATFNFSTLRSRQERGRYLAARAKAEDADWIGLLEELSQRVVTAERSGQPAVLLRDLERPSAASVVHVEGMPILMQHPMIIFGDGATAKSYLGLYLAGRLSVDHGVRVGLFDWELCGEDHRDRLERLFGADMPNIRYARCDRPFVHEVDRLRRIVADQALDYVVLDSVAFACDGPPEAAEVASRYFQAVRRLGIVGSLHVAHVSKAEGADQKPFGSTFWHNGARATWNVKIAGPVADARTITIGLYHRKANLGGLRRPLGYEITFDDERTTFRRVEVADIPDLAGHLSVRQRMSHLLKSGAMDPKVIADELAAETDTIKRYARRYDQFTVIPGGRIALLDRGHS